MKRNWKKCCLSFAVAISMSVTGVMTMPVVPVMAAEVSGTVITSMAYEEGPTFTASGLSEASFGFRMPKFNGGDASWGDVASDLGVNVKVDGTWKDIDSLTKYVYNSNWGHWSDGGASGFWFKVKESTYIQLYSKSNPGVTLEYNMILNSTDASSVTALTPVAETTISANRTGSGFIAFPNAVANGANYPTGADNLVAYVKSVGEPDSAYVNIDNNAESGWIYNTNFGIEQYGYWFKVAESGSINVKLALKDHENVSIVYTITYSDTIRDNYQVYANGATTITADSETGAAGVVFPSIGGTGTDNHPTNKELDKFVIEYYDAQSGSWVEFSNSAASGWYYQGNGYVNYSAKNQWGYFDDYVYGLWFQPITEDFKLRIGYPLNGEKGGEVGANYIEYQFIGAPNAYRPEDVEVSDITVGGENSDPNALDGWNLYYNDEFSGNSLDMSSWSYNTGYFLDTSDPGTFGWGNNEAEYYTDKEENIFVKDGSLHLVAKYDPYTFTCTDEAQTKVTADYSSGKIISKDKVAFTYGRVDFRAKLPAGNGLWPALWLLPNDDSYGVWAASGEIDVMEARGRINNSTSGTIHYGGTWPNNKYTGSDYIFEDGSTYDDGYHVYSVIWEKDSITWYVDGNFFQYIPKSLWYSANSDSDTAPFDKDFYLIMNLAVGGWFDGGVMPDEDFSSAEMLVDYVRVYKAEGSEEVETVPIEGLTLDKSDVVLNVGQTTDLMKTYAPANTTQRNVVWTSSDESVATVSVGQVKAVGEGTAVITATSAVNPAISASCKITVSKSDTPSTGGDQGDKKDDTGSGSTGGNTGDNTGESTGGNTGSKGDDSDIAADDFTATAEYGVHYNKNKTATFYVKAKDTAFAPMLYWGTNKTNPTLGDLGGVVLEKNSKIGENYFSYTTTQKFEASDDVSYLFSYTPVDGNGRMDTAITTVTLSKADDATIKVPDDKKDDVKDDDKKDDTKKDDTKDDDKKDDGKQDPSENPGEVKPQDEYGAFTTDDGKVTFYVKAKDTAFAPMLYWGINKVNPQLWQLGGVVLQKDTALGENYFSYTTDQMIAASDSVSYMFSYVPLDKLARIDTEITTRKVSELTAPKTEEEQEDGAYGMKRNADGKVTMYIYANENEAAPLVFWGLNKTNPQLWQLNGAVMQRSGSKEGLFTYTLPEKLVSGTTVSYMFGYTPLGEVGRRDTAITTETVR